MVEKSSRYFYFILAVRPSFVSAALLRAFVALGLGYPALAGQTAHKVVALRLPLRREGLPVVVVATAEVAVVGKGVGLGPAVYMSETAMRKH